MPIAVDHRPRHRFRARHVFGVLRLRRPAAQHTDAEAELLRRHASGALTVVEIGVAEGGSALELREVMAAGGTLHLIDPYEPGQLRVSLPLILARRVVGSVGNGTVRWWRDYSYQAAAGWTEPIDFLFVDGDHSYDGVTRDWEDWSPHIRIGGHAALHDARTFPGGWARADTGPVRLAAAIESDRRWRLVGHAHSTVVFQRVAA